MGPDSSLQPLRAGRGLGTLQPLVYGGGLYGGFQLLGKGGISAYPVFILAGLLPLQFFCTTLSSTTVGLGLLLAAANVHFRDTQQIVDIVVLPWFHLTPVISPLDVIQKPSLPLAVQLLNLMAGLAVVFRKVLYYLDNPNLLRLAVTALESIVLLMIGALIFKRLSPNFAEEV